MLTDDATGSGVGSSAGSVGSSVGSAGSSVGSAGRVGSSAGSAGSVGSVGSSVGSGVGSSAGSAGSVGSSVGRVGSTAGSVGSSVGSSAGRVGSSVGRVGSLLIRILRPSLSCFDGSKWPEFPFGDVLQNRPGDRASDSHDRDLVRFLDPAEEPEHPIRTRTAVPCLLDCGRWIEFFEPFQGGLACAKVGDAKRNRFQRGHLTS